MFFSVNNEQTTKITVFGVAKTIIKLMLNKIKDLTFSCFYCGAVDIIGEETLNTYIGNSVKDSISFDRK